MSKVPGVPGVPVVPVVRGVPKFACVLLLLISNPAYGQHEADIITSQKLSLTGWTRSVDKMVRWGASITPDERDVLQPYLAQHFAPRPVASHGSTDSDATFKRVCLTCHEADIIAQQKLTPTGWTRSVEKMMRWGAAVSDAEKQPLVDYLATRFGPP